MHSGSTDLAASLALSGYAWHSRRYQTSQQIKNAEQIARREEHGLWSQDDPVPPWEYRDGPPAQPKSRELTAGTVLFVVIVVAVLVLISLAGG